MATPESNPLDASRPVGDAAPLAVAHGYRVLKASKEYSLKRPCPYCGGKLKMSINGCELDEATGWIATELDINCDTEPDFDGKKTDWLIRAGLLTNKAANVQSEPRSQQKNT